MAHEEYRGLCPLGMETGEFTNTLLSCFEKSAEGVNPDVSCVHEALNTQELNEECIKCIEHFLEDHFVDEMSKCPPEYLRTGADREQCASVIVAAIDQHCY